MLELGRVYIEPVNGVRMAMTWEQHDQSRYSRFQRFDVLRAALDKIRLQCINMIKSGDLPGGGTPIAFLTGALQVTLQRVYLLGGQLVIDPPKVIGSVSIPAGTKSVVVDVSTVGVEPGLHRINIAGLAPGESNPAYFIYHCPPGHDPRQQQDLIAIAQGTYEGEQRGWPDQRWAVVPRAALKARALPLTARRNYASTDIVRSKLHCEHLVPMRWGDMHRPNVNVDGIVSTFDRQAYDWSTLHAKLPTIALLDGPRGVGSLPMPTHLQISAAVVDGVPRNNTYFCDPWRIGKISEDGTITTLVGYRHRGIMGHWEDADVRPDRPEVSAFSQLEMMNIELVGDWSAIPEARRGFWELWGMAWDERTLIPDTSAQKILNDVTGRMESPHAAPVLFAADSQHNRICRIEFSATQHGVPPVVTEFIAAQDPWDCVCADGVLYVSERKAHRIAAYDATTGQLLRVVVQGQALATINDQVRSVTLTTTLDAARAAPCVAPEGLFLQDGWLYFASKAQAQVRRVRLDGTDLQVVRPITLSTGSQFAKLAVSDGTFGPRGTTFTWTWSNGQFGGPEIVTPDGKIIGLWGGVSGGTGWWQAYSGYGTCGAVAHGRLICGNMLDGLFRITASQPADVIYPESATNPVVMGHAEYKARGLHLVHGEHGMGYYDLPHGHHGYGFYDLPLPWGLSANIDAYLANRGHVRPA